MTRFESLYIRVQDAARRRSIAVLAVLAILIVAASAGLSTLRLDLSFRPLFASAGDIAAPTEEFEAEFGQSSGAWAVAILENKGVTASQFVRETARLSGLVRELPGVTEVLSLPDIRMPYWSQGKLSLFAAIPSRMLDPAADEELGDKYDELLDGTRFVNWLVSKDGSRLLLSARLAAPLDDLDARRSVVSDFQSLLETQAAPELGVHFSGVSVVELAYEKQVLKDQLVATAITSVILVLLLVWTFGNLASVLVCLTPVTLAIPATLGIMGWLGQPVTIINTVIPVIILVIGVADAVHMLTAWLEARDDGKNQDAATRSMLLTTGKACFLTTVTTIGGFLALQSADLVSVGNFGLSVAIGILTAWIANQILLPWLLRRIDIGRGLPDGSVNRLADRAISTSLQLAESRPYTVLAISLAITVGCCLMIPSLNVDQKFNEELPASHPITQGQKILEQDFGGFLGPEISIRRTDGASMVDDESFSRLDRFATALRDFPETQHVWSIRDLMPPQVDQSDRSDVLEAMRHEPAISRRQGELINNAGNRLAVIVRIGDIGTRRADEYRGEIQQLADEIWDESYEVEVVGQWWLAQHGMRLLLRDMLTSLATAMLIVLPLVWLAVGAPKLVAAATAANVLPLALPLAFMAATGITLRIGTAVVLAIALGIVVDNTLHIITRIRAHSERVDKSDDQFGGAMRGTGRAVVFTTLALVGGFLSMMSNQLLAIRDMGLVAAVTIVGAMLADLLLLPAIYIALSPRSILKSPVELQVPAD